MKETQPHTALNQTEAKRTTVIDLNTRILVTIEDPEALEMEMLETEDVMYNLAETLSSSVGKT